MSTNTAPVENTSGGFGLLQINTFLNDVGRPAANATVRVIDPATQRVIEEAVTDGDGKIGEIALPTPPIDYSLEPDSPRPFNQYNVSVSFPDYTTAEIENVQLFPSCTAIQNVDLKPVFDSVTIPYPTIWGEYPSKIPESEIKKLPFANDLAVLPKPIVPSIIVVHNGVPSNSSAANYTVSFKNYIKNVASSEIYSTWPRETLKANILAIISFTLNRVYTEWYRNKGYSFTITNSTSYDQAFTYGRNIYKEISDVVDELFTTYISKPDIIQPLFTQYCDGRSVTCPNWLSQWGSKELGDSGLTAIQILRNYYGSDIILKQAEKVDGIPLSFPGVLSNGSRGSSVRTIQRQLNAIANNYPSIKKLAVDGIYGPKTAESVRTFQRIFDLPVDGRVNFPTWYSISGIYVAVENLS
ncbi:MAG: peptidoglycan-binding protein [Clostridia bacterium]|nr:peptidoglycan-binding protein [Clostridia bacterium]